MRWVATACFMVAGLSAAQGQEQGNGGAVTVQPGMWESTVTMDELTITGMPEAQLAEIRRTMSPPRTQSRCMTAAEAADPLSTLQTEGECTLTRNAFSGGVIDIIGTCRPPGRPEVRMSFAGTYTADTLSARLEVEGETGQAVAGVPQRLHMINTLRGRRTGHCPAAS